ncbi:MAG: tyrosine--tRNA ligase [Candidatus Aenigmarchaeota archaeon]|nr:tyrosine--tRNA ligase [Candidatus Aenigmarchaeota archaeon]
MDTERKLDLITRNTEEVMTEEDLKMMISSGTSLRHYIGFEISGKIHLGSGLMSMSKVRDFMDAGASCSIFLADWHTWINDKLGGDREAIKRVAVGYFKEGLKASLECAGGDPEKIRFVLGTELYHNNDEYWETLVEIGKNTSLARIQRSITIMGRKEGESVDFARLLYPGMQVADIFFQGINLPHAGLDQRKAHVIAREAAPRLKIRPLLDKKGNKIKPVAVHHHLLLGLQKPPMWPVPKENIQELWSSMKMSKSIPNSAVFIHDSPEEVKAKLNKAFCPEKETEFNPVLDWARHLVFGNEKASLKVEREGKFGGEITYHGFDELKSDFEKGRLHPMDLKNAMAERLIALLKPARDHFDKPRNRQRLEELDQLITG